ncbi:MAG: hypothetical protein D6748_04465 [Calditrichaeota bacterium]|nr:MAG: hypothetical protein D6748_04465 [Calditrichota bacterium]
MTLNLQFTLSDIIFIPKCSRSTLLLYQSSWGNFSDPRVKKLTPLVESPSPQMGRRHFLDRLKFTGFDAE